MGAAPPPQGKQSGPPMAVPGGMFGTAPGGPPPRQYTPNPFAGQANPAARNAAVGGPGMSSAPPPSMAQFNQSRQPQAPAPNVLAQALRARLGK
jgi:hypothetical protein